MSSETAEAVVTAISSERGGPRVAVLGAGPAGVAAALALSRNTDARVTVIEQRDTSGGNAGSFQLDGVWCDHGSHRLHPAAEARVLDEIKAVLGPDLLWRPRHGRILLQNRWIHFPLKPEDLLLRLPKRFAAGLALDVVRKPFLGAREEENFATVLERGLGATICHAFYYPYVQKLWGLAPDQLAVTLARRRVSGSSVSRIMRKVARQIPGLRSSTAGGFYYPRQGFGRISEGFRESAEALGTNFVFGARVAGVGLKDGRVGCVRYEQDGQMHDQPFDVVWSTLPVSLLARMIEPSAPASVLGAASRISFRGMILIYLVLDTNQFTEFDAHYFPELSIPVSRMSEPKNYSGSKEPMGRTVLCAELPSDPGDEHWELDDNQLGERLCGWLRSVGLPVEAPVRRVLTRRLRFAYPVYDRDYESHFRVMDDWLAGIDNLLTFGRQGLFAHDNTHHAMTMAFAAVDCFGSRGEFDRSRWAACRQEFESHVVED